MAKSKYNKNLSQYSKEQLRQLVNRGGKRKLLAMNELVKRNSNLAVDFPPSILEEAKVVGSEAYVMVQTINNDLYNIKSGKTSNIILPSEDGYEIYEEGGV